MTPTFPPTKPAPPRSGRAAGPAVRTQKGTGSRSRLCPAPRSKPGARYPLPGWAPGPSSLLHPSRTQKATSRAFQRLGNSTLRPRQFDPLLREMADEARRAL